MGPSIEVWGSFSIMQLENFRICGVKFSIERADLPHGTNDESSDTRDIDSNIIHIECARADVPTSLLNGPITRAVIFVHDHTYNE